MSGQAALEQAFSLYQAGRVEEAAAACRAIVATTPRSGDAHHLLGIIAHRAGRPEEAAAHVARAIEANPRQAEYRNTLGAIQRALGQTAVAIASFEAALEIAPGHAQALANLGNALAHDSQFAAAADAYRRALTLAPNSTGVHNNLGNVLRELGDIEGAISSFEAALALNPNYVEAQANRGVALVAAERLGEAVEAYRAALAIDPDYLPALANIGNALLVIGGHEEAMSAYQKALALAPDFPQFHLNMAALQNYLESSTAHRALSVARRYGQSLPRANPVDFRNTRDLDRRLRIGFVSGDLRMHAVASFLMPLLLEQSPTALEFSAYSMNPRDDDTTDIIRSVTHHWRDIRNVATASVVEMIRSDEIDILIDLTGYTDGTRLDVFAARAAPIQLGWLGYSGTTGVPEMDYVLADQWVAPQGSEDEFSELVWRLPDSYLCFGQPDWPQPTELPAHRKGFVTFGSFNNIGKIGPRTADTWAEILRAVPNSRLVIKSSRGGVADRLAELKAVFAESGVDEKRLQFIDRVPDHAAHLALYGDVDIALDPFPYNGTTTTCEAMWMGVPVLGMRGNSFVSRVGESLLNNVGLADWIAEDRADYVARAVRFSADLGGLATLRSQLRQQFAHSPLGDARRFAGGFEAAMRQMWVRWCQGEAPLSH